MDVPEKRARTEKRTCIICSKISPINELIRPRDHQLRATLLNAASVQNFSAILDLREDEYDEKWYYHRHCRSTFTHRKTLESIPEKPGQSTPRTDLRKSLREPSTSSSRVLEDICIFCDKKNKYAPGSKSRELLIQDCELRSDQTVRMAAMRKLDNKILPLASRDLVAAEAHYHKSCNRNYTREDRPPSTSASATTNDQQYQIDEQNAYQVLFEHVRKQIFAKPHVVRMTNLSDVLVKCMNTLGYTSSEVKPQTRKHIRRKLENEFSDSLHFVSDETGKAIIFPDNLTIESLVVENIQLKEKLASTTLTENLEHVLRASACNIRADIKSMKSKQWPPNPDELNVDYLELPESLVTFLTTLFMGDVPQIETTPRIHRLVQSLGQDCVYAVSGGKIIPAKQILLPWGVKSLTGNVELIKILNRFGHGISYSKLEEMDTAICLHKIETQAEQGVILLVVTRVSLQP